MNNITKRVLVFGATSAIAHELLKLYAAEASLFFLVARDANKVDAIGDDLRVRGGTISGTKNYDFNNFNETTSTLAEAKSALGEIDIILIAHGSLPDQAQCEISSEAVKACMDDNFTSAAMIIQSCAQLLGEQEHGTLAVISSVAGDRGRKSNYVYGAAKAGIDTLLQGLRGRFSGTAVKIVNLKPGMVKTPMTADMDRQGPLWSTPAAIAPALYRSIDKGLAVTYVPGYWRLVMWIIRTLPTAILARLPI